MKSEKQRYYQVIAVRLCIWPVILTLLTLPFLPGADNSKNSYPNKPIEVVVPFKAGGGTDILVRMFQKTINKKKLLPVPLVIVNRPGAGGSDGSRFVKDSEADGYTVLNLHDAIIISKHFGKVDFGPEAFEPVAGTVKSELVIVVKENSPFKSLSGLVQAAREKPGEIIFGCALGTPTHVTGLQLQKDQDIKLNLIQSGGGAARLEQLMGGHIDVSVFSVLEYLNFESQGLKALALISSERHPELPALETAKEQGVNIVNDIIFYWWFPKGTDLKKVKYLADVFNEALQDEELQGYIRQSKMSGDFLTGDLLQARIKKTESTISSLESGEEHDLPPFHLLTAGIVFLLFLYILFDSYRRKSELVPRPELNTKPALITIGLTILYIFLMGNGIFDFRVLTFAFMMTLGLCLTDKKTLNKTVLIECSLLISLGLYYVFTSIVHVDLP